MPTISMFYGIIIQMYFDDHNPPHFHVIYNDFKAIINILDFSILQGNLPPKALGLIMEWAVIHKEELLKEWNLAKTNQTLFQIEPLQ